MQKSKGIKIAALLCGAIVVIAGIVLAASYFFEKEDTYRSILVYELEGKAEIEREKTGSISAAENIYLESGDTLTVADDSYIRLKLDDDKYIMVEENTVLSIEAAGNEEDSKTKIQLVQGAITSEIQNPLSTDSEYEVTSPNSVMAVRGTIFRVETEMVQGNTPYTKTSVFSGKVSMGVLLEDGTTGDIALIGAGEEGYGEGDNPIESNEIDYSALPPQAIRVLQDLLDEGASLQGITKEELDELAGEPGQSKEEAEDKKNTESAENAAENTDNPKSASASDPTGTTGGSDNGTTGSQTSAGETGQTDSNGTGGTPDDSNSNTEYTVTFLYQDKVFATQTVRNGQYAKKPTLTPAVFGAWDFDFSTKITQDITINWQ